VTENEQGTLANIKLLYVGDQGTLPIDTRLALCKLLQGPFIDGDSVHWKAVLRDEAVLRAGSAGAIVFF